MDYYVDDNNNITNNGVYDGVCTSTVSGFLMILGAAGISFLIIAICTLLNNARPTKGSVSYGLPYRVMILFAELCFWNVLPNVVLFVIFKVATEDLLPETSKMACVTVGTSPPVLAIYFLLFSITFLVTSNTADIRETCITLMMRKTQTLNADAASGAAMYQSTTGFAPSKRRSDESLKEQDLEVEDQEQHQQIQSPQEQQDDESPLSPARTMDAPKILVIGAIQRGAVFAHYRKEVLLRHPKAVIVNLVFSGVDDHVRNNVEVLEALPDGARVDSVVVAPPPISQADIYQFYLRTKEHEDDNDLKKMKKEAEKRGETFERTVLIAKGGLIPSFFDTDSLGLKQGFFDEIVILPFTRNSPPIGSFLTQENTKMLRMVDMLRSVSNTLRPGGYLTAMDVLGSGVMLERDVVDSGIFTNIKIQEDKDVQLGPIGFRSETVTVTARKKSVEAISRVRLETSEGDASFTLMEKGSADNFLSENMKLFVIGAVQTCIFLALLFIGAALFKSLDLPDSVPLGSRLSNPPVSIATSYVMIAYIFRQALVESVPANGVGMLIMIILKSDVLVIAASIFFTILFWIPTFLLQLAFHETSLSVTSRSIIGTVISITIGFVGYKRGRKASTRATLKSRGIAEAMIERIISKM